MSNQPVIFNIQYTPYSLPKSATSVERAAHADKRAFYDMTGGKNIFDYMTTEDKQVGKSSVFKSMFDYLQKNTGVFNDKGLLTEKQIAAMKVRLKMNKGNIYHGFISLNKEESHKIDTPEKCIEFVKRNFPTFLKDARFHNDNIDLMCALHMDRPHHLHLHFVFWEKEPKYKGKDGTLTYRRHSKIDKKAIDNMVVRMGLYLDDRRNRLYKTRKEAIKDLKELLRPSNSMNSTEDIRDELVELAKDLPKTGRLSYGSENMKPYRERVDRIVQMLLRYDGRARKADKEFHLALEQRRQAVKNICGTEQVFSDKKASISDMEGASQKYHYKIDEKSIRVIEQIEEEYARRQGNLVLNLARYIQPKVDVYDGRKLYKANDIRLKKALGISRRIVNRDCRKFILSFGKECDDLKRDFSSRLQEIEEEIKREQEKKIFQEDYKN